MKRRKGGIMKEFRPLIAKYKKRLCEIKNLPADAESVEYLDIRSKEGMQVYERSLVFLLMKAFYDIEGKRSDKQLRVEFSTGNGLFINEKNKEYLSDETLITLENRMRECIKQNLDIVKTSINTEEAIRIFKERKMYDKVNLLKFYRASSIHIYSIEDYKDYYYGYMVQSCGLLEDFRIERYRHGFVLLMPKKSNNYEVPKFSPAHKVFDALESASEWADDIGIRDVGELNTSICNGRTNDVIWMTEALMEKRIGDIAVEIINRKGTKFIMIAGPTSSGKTTFSHRLAIQLRANGLNPYTIEVDNYFKNREDSPRDEFGNFDFESIEAVDIELFNNDMKRLIDGERIELPKFNFKTGFREYNGEFLQLKEEDVLVIEGIHCLNNRLSYMLPNEYKYRIYISALTQLNIDDHNRISTADGRLLRRMVRDARTRGIGASSTLSRWDSVRRGEEKYIFPFQDSADTVFNSATIYELSVLKPYAEALLFGIEKEDPNYIEARRLLNFLDYFIGLSENAVPNNSILKEFIGGSCFHV